MAQLISGFKNSQKIRVILRYPEHDVSFPLYTTISEVFRGQIGSIYQTEAVISTLADLGQHLVRGTVKRYGDLDVQVDVL